MEQVGILVLYEIVWCLKMQGVSAHKHQQIGFVQYKGRQNGCQCTYQRLIISKSMDTCWQKNRKMQSPIQFMFRSSCSSGSWISDDHKQSWTIKATNKDLFWTHSKDDKIHIVLICSRGSALWASWISRIHVVHNINHSMETGLGNHLYSDGHAGSGIKRDQNWCLVFNYM